MLKDRPLPPLASIRAFEAAARLGSFARAAAELGTSAASVSYHVRQLERDVGVALFARHAQSVTLTAEGAAIAPDVAAAFAGLRATFARAGESAEARLVVSALPTFGASWLAPKLGGFRARAAGIEVELDLSEAPRDLAAGAADAAIRNGHGKWPGLRAIRLFDSVFMPLCAPALQDAARDIADPRRPIAAPLLGRRDWWALWYASLGHRDVDLSGRFGPKFQAEHLDASAAIAGQGVTIGSPILFADDIRAGRLVPAHDAIANTGRSFWLVYPALRERTKKVALFRDWLLAEASAANAHAPAA